MSILEHRAPWPVLGDLVDGEGPSTTRASASQSQVSWRMDRKEVARKWMEVAGSERLEIFLGLPKGFIKAVLTPPSKK